MNAAMERKLGRQMLKLVRDEGHRPRFPEIKNRNEKGYLAQTTANLLDMSAKGNGVLQSPALADELGLNRVSIYTLVSRMVTRGLISREVSKDNEGRKLVHLRATEAGRLAVEAAE